MTTITNDWAERNYTLLVDGVDYDVKAFVYLRIKDGTKCNHVCDYTLEGWECLPAIGDSIMVGRYSAREILDNLGDPVKSNQMKAAGWNLEELRSECEKSIASHEKEIENQILQRLDDDYGTN